MIHPPANILVVCTQRLGDVLLATPLLRSLKGAWPMAQIDVLVLQGTQSALAGNPDVHTVLAWPQRTGFAGKLRQIRQLWRRYDLAFAANPTDRSRLYAWLGSRRRVGFLTGQRSERGKRWLLNLAVPFDDLDTHTVSMMVRLGEAVGCAPQHKVTPPALDDGVADALWRRFPELASQPFALLHPHPKFAYKMWPAAGWIELAQWLTARGLRVLLSGGGEAHERAYVEGIAAAVPAATNLAGSLSLAAAATLLKRAALYVGPDTVMTHIAAACGTPCLALFGPSNPVKWGPWPATWAEARSPWPRQVSAAQARQGNVWLLQGHQDTPGRNCVPCLLEGCERHINSRSDCLHNLTAAEVIHAARSLLDASAR